MSAIFLGMTILEVSMYLSYRAKAELFLRKRELKTSQKQFANLLDVVPDSVYICSNADRETQSQPIYANSNMNRFFGRDLIARDDSKAKRLKKRKAKKPSN